VHRITLIAGIGFILLGAFLFVYPLHLLVLEKNDNWIFVRVVQPGNTFSLAYLHSVTLSDVWENFKIDRDYRIVLTETRFQGQGAGLPSAGLPNERWTREGDWFHITEMNRVVSTPLLWRADSQWRSRFQFSGKKEEYIASQVGDGLIKIDICRSNVLRWLLYRLKSHLW
jgi:hypothetical protein